MNELVICRCEGVSLKEILEAINNGATSVQGIKKRCRLGMGICQGRTCQPVVRDFLIMEQGSCSIEHIQKVQTPIRPIPLGKM